MSQDKNSEEDLKKYKDLSGISLREMNFGLWFSENRRKLTIALTFFLILISAFFFVYSFYAYFIYFSNDSLDSQTEIVVTSPRNIMSDLEIGDLKIFSVHDSKDLSISLQNKNNNFWASFDYCFYQGEEAIHCDNGFILPLEKRYVLFQGLEEVNGQDIVFKIEDMYWSRINKKDIPNWNDFAQTRINFIFNNVELLNANRSGLSENLKLSSLDFIAQNKSAYSYYEVAFEILLFDDQELVGVEEYLAKDFMSGEKRLVKMSWLDNLGGANRVEIRPIINIMDVSNYFKYQGTN